MSQPAPKKRPAKTLTKKKLEEFDKANDLDYLSDEGDYAAKALLSCIIRANASAIYPPKKPMTKAQRKIQRGTALGAQQ